MSDIISKGIDVSKHQGTINWSKVKGNVDFAIIRAGYGRTISQKDSKFESNYQGCKDNGIPCGAYWYSYAVTVSDIQIEANVFLEAIKGKTFEYPVYLDIEESTQAKLSSTTINAMIKTFCEIMEDNGYYVGVYSYDSFFSKVSSEVQSCYTLWVANTSTYPHYASTYAIHQHSFTGSVSGISGDVDLNNCYVDFPAIIKSKGFNGFEVDSTNDSDSDSTDNSVTETETKTITHTVVKGDTLSAIAKKYGTTVSAIVSENKSKYPKITANYIQIGWILEFSTDC